MRKLKIKFIEVWKDLIYNGDTTNYMISNKGKIMNKLNGNLLKPFISNNGYKRVCISMDGFKINISIHRYVAIHFVKNGFDLEKQVNHRNGNKLNNTEFNLEWVTSKENIQHAIEHRLRICEGESNPFNKHSEKMIIKICELLAKGYGTRKIRKKLEIPKENKSFRYLVNDIKRRHTWAYLSEKYNW
jgi:NUMOD4 motif.